MFSNLEYNISITKLFPYIIYQAHQQLYTVIVMGTSIGEHLFKTHLCEKNKYLCMTIK